MNSQAPGAELLHDSGSIEFNRALLVDPKCVAHNPFPLLAALEDPDLPMLSPLSKYLFYHSSPALSGIDLRDCLKSTHVAINQIRDERPTRECVHFELERVLGKHTFSLLFSSEAELIWAGEDNECVGESIDMVIPLLSLADRLARLPSLTMTELAEFLCSEADTLLAKQRRSESPIGYITDDSAFVCSITHRLVSINGVGLDSELVIDDSVHDTSIQRTGAFFREIDRDEKFSWIEILDNDDRSKIGIADIDQADIGPDCTDNEQLYLTAESLEWHYQRGRVESTGSNDICVVSILFGAGVGWDPDWAQHQRDVSGLGEYPEECPPTHKLIISSSEAAADEERSLMYVLSLLAETIRTRWCS